MKSYRVLSNQIFTSGEYSLVPIRHEDRYSIMQWRNEQIYHLRQAEPLTKERQDYYFEHVVAQLFDQEKPNQILFSFLQDEQCIGYGGLVHINWIDKNAEISFIMDTQLEKEHFHFHWKTYLSLLEQVAFKELGLHKIYTYAFDLRPHLYEAVESAGYEKEAVLKEHCLFEGNFKDVVIHTKKSPFIIRKLNKEDLELLFDWANDETVRESAFNSEPIDFNVHKKWFFSKLNNYNSKIFILEINQTPVAQIRFDLYENSNFWTIDYSVAKDYRGQNLGRLVLYKGIEMMANRPIKAEVKTTNIPSLKCFRKIKSFKELPEKNNLITFIKNG